MTETRWNHQARDAGVCAPNCAEGSLRISRMLRQRSSNSSRAHAPHGLQLRKDFDAIVGAPDAQLVKDHWTINTLQGKGSKPFEVGPWGSRCHLSTHECLPTVGRPRNARCPVHEGSEVIRASGGSVRSTRSVATAQRTNSNAEALPEVWAPSEQSCRPRQVWQRSLQRHCEASGNPRAGKAKHEVALVLLTLVAAAASRSSEEATHATAHKAQRLSRQHRIRGSEVFAALREDKAKRD
mmetsp:Transcript_19381/g.41256  ORF Transcript_19381/g.41256 Transcript_19381/m.41256 type:complete len:239 (+) Transcript_19381:315-1031(+)